MLLVGFAGAFRRPDVCDLIWDDITITDAGLIVQLRRSKTDRAGRGTEVGIPRGTSTTTCPVTALENWRNRVRQQLRVSDQDLQDLPLFTTIGRSGRIGTTPLTPEALTRMVRRRAEQAGIVGLWGGRSLRAGFITSAADLDIPLERIAQQSRHATLDSLILYIRTDDPFRHNPLNRLDL